MRLCERVARNDRGAAAASTIGRRRFASVKERGHHIVMFDLARSTARRALIGSAAAGALGILGARSNGRAAARRQMAEGIRAVYLNPLALSVEQVVGLVRLIEETEINAVVVDVKEDGIYVPTDADLFLAAGEVNSAILDADALLRTLAERNIYSIARVVTFRDSYLAEARPDLAVLDAVTGQPWRSYDGLAWLNPFKQETWEAYARFASELAAQGFDEIQFDYVRFPSDGDMSTLDFGLPVDETLRSDTIAAFLGYCGDELRPSGVRTAADVFGYTLLLDDIGIGQNIAKIAEVVDVICPMIYPSHFPEGSIAVPGHPNDFPRETIEISLAAGATKVEPGRLRPWLQDFSLAGMTPYSEFHVREQIDAAEAAGAGGWMLWAADSVYTNAALRPGA